MSTLQSTLPSLQPGLRERLSGWWQQQRAALRAWQQRRRAARRLPDLDDAALRDLGLGHGELLSHWAEVEGLVEATRLRVLSRLDTRLGL